MTISTTFTVEGETFNTREEAEAYQLRCERIKEVSHLFDAVLPKQMAYVKRIELTTDNQLAEFFVDNVETYKEAMEVFKS